ncbi:muscle-specific protein 300 kDa-like [Choristoneura fumiferana]|uniref:muscle-specific protein 300 kDa-like n=1 Tax=Choristoneura fumiferana TaxID=7141 RepID=UPI003D15E77C
MSLIVEVFLSVPLVGPGGGARVRAREPLRLDRAGADLQRDFRRFSELRDDLTRAEPRVHALHDAAQLLRSGDAPPNSDDICRRLGELRLRLQSLRKLSGVYALKLGAALARQPRATSALAAVAAAAAAAPMLMEEEEEQISLGTSDLPPLDENDVVVSDDEDLTRLQRGLRFVCRVARASIPFQALLLLLLGAAALAPHSHSDCRTPGFAMEPVLRYPDGPPPL